MGASPANKPEPLLAEGASPRRGSSLASPRNEPLLAEEQASPRRGTSLSPPRNRGSPRKPPSSTHRRARDGARPRGWDGALPRGRGGAHPRGRARARTFSATKASSLLATEVIGLPARRQGGRAPSSPLRRPGFLLACWGDRAPACSPGRPGFLPAAEARGLPPPSGGGLPPHRQGQTVIEHKKAWPRHLLHVRHGDVERAWAHPPFGP